MTHTTLPSDLRGPSALTTLEELARRRRTERVVLVEVGREPAVSPAAPGTLRLTLDDLAGPEGRETGHRPLPDHGEFVRLLDSAGISPSTPVAVYAQQPGDLAGAARAWVVLRWAGVRDVSYLNDAHADALADAALPPIAGFSAAAPPQRFTPDTSVVAEIDTIVGLPTGTLLIDARATDAFGEDQHIPGAVNVPSSLLTDSGRIKDEPGLQAAYQAALGAVPDERPVVVYCGSGVSASVQALALGSLGVTAPVYIGSWSEWSKRRRPAAPADS